MNIYGYRFANFCRIRNRQVLYSDPEDRFHPNMGLGARLGTSNPSGLIGEESSSPADRRSQIVHAYEARHQQRNRESEQCKLYKK